MYEPSIPTVGQKVTCSVSPWLNPARAQFDSGRVRAPRRKAQPDDAAHRDPVADEVVEPGLDEEARATARLFLEEEGRGRAAGVVALHRDDPRTGDTEAGRGSRRRR